MSVQYGRHFGYKYSHFGEDTKGHDIKGFGDTTARYMLWDASADELILTDSVSLNFGTSNDVDMRWDGTDFDILAAADDSIIKFGNGTNSFDVWIYGNAATDYVLWDASANKMSLAGDAYLLLDSYQRTVTAKTASYTLTAADSGGVFTTTGAAGAIVFTLPAVATSTGYEYTFLNTVDQNMTITAPAGTLVVFNNAAATSIAFSTLSEKIGAAVKVTCDGAKWIAQVMLGAETQTPTIA